MNTAIVKATADVNMDDLQRQAKMMVASGYFDASRDATQAIAQLAVKILAGREMGYGPFASVQGIHVIQGKPSLSANLMAAAVKAHPHYNYRVRKMSNEAVIVEFFENNESLGISEFTQEDAKKAGTQNMGKFPRNMLFARALSNGVRWYCPDVFNGSTVYVPEELGVDVDDNGNVIDATMRRIDSHEVVEQPQHRNSVQEAPTEADNPFNDEAPPVEAPKPPVNGQRKAGLITQSQMNTLHALGSALYNGEWNDKRHALVNTVTQGRSKSSDDLFQAEAMKLIEGIEKKLRTAYEELANQMVIEVATLDPNVFAEIGELSGVELANSYKDLKKLQRENTVSEIPA